MSFFILNIKSRDDYEDEIERRNQEAISRETGYKFPKGSSDNDAKAWQWHMGEQELTDEEGSENMRKAIEERKYGSEGDGWMSQPKWRG